MDLPDFIKFDPIGRVFTISTVDTSLANEYEIVMIALLDEPYNTQVSYSWILRLIIDGYQVE